MALVSAVWDKLLGSVSAPVRPSVSQGNGLRLESAPYHVPLRNLSRCRAQNSVGTSSSPSDSCLTWRTPVTRLPQPLVPTCQWSAAGELGLLRHPPHAAGVSADVVPGTQSSPAATGVRIGRTQGRHMGPMTAPVRTVRSAELLPQERELLQTSGVIVAALLRKERLVTVPEAGGQHDQPVRPVEEPRRIDPVRLLLLIGGERPCQRVELEQQLFHTHCRVKQLVPKIDLVPLDIDLHDVNGFVPEYLHNTGEGLKPHFDRLVAGGVHLKRAIVGIGIQAPWMELPVDFVLDFLHHRHNMRRRIKRVDLTILRYRLFKRVVGAHPKTVGHAPLLHDRGGHADDPPSVAAVPEPLPVWADRVALLLDDLRVQVNGVRRLRLSAPFVGVAGTAEV
mmetsp:Transcript_71296/g.119298  ORF Transcript_71296/g.119298 Transcript_71296/m.119298 type:complete len:393 (+) Transcript_71296:702-1880(+)